MQYYTGFFYKTSHLNEEVNSTEHPLQLVFPGLIESYEV
jgi:hypothetical protein